MFYGLQNAYLIRTHGFTCKYHVKMKLFSIIVWHFRQFLSKSTLFRKFKQILKFQRFFELVPQFSLNLVKNLTISSFYGPSKTLFWNFAKNYFLVIFWGKKGWKWPFWCIFSNFAIFCHPKTWLKLKIFQISQITFLKDLMKMPCEKNCENPMKIERQFQFSPKFSLKLGYIFYI